MSETTVDEDQDEIGESGEYEPKLSEVRNLLPYCMLSLDYSVAV